MRHSLERVCRPEHQAEAGVTHCDEEELLPSRKLFKINMIISNTFC